MDTIAVTRLYGKYRISNGDGTPIDAANLTEVKEALSHFYDTREAGRKGSHHLGRPKCPYCRLMGLA
ncbi:hypothetical protein LCGC14_2449570 [marine sediment metagenome]|uniref:Uncharacterized protein n=1 Tax=marine sediment metagenome TaxID=412755 RepID=A0A0F9C450_9ZZZZ